MPSNRDSKGHGLTAAGRSSDHVPRSVWLARSALVGVRSQSARLLSRVSASASFLIAVRTVTSRPVSVRPAVVVARRSQG